MGGPAIPQGPLTCPRPGKEGKDGDVWEREGGGEDGARQRHKRPAFDSAMDPSYSAVSLRLSVVE